MKITIVAVAMTLVAISSSAVFAQSSSGGHGMSDKFGPEFSMSLNGHDMYFQAIKDKANHQWVIISRADAEVMMGHKLDAVQFYDFEAQTR